ncbi:VOC family protein [Tropicimonas sp.]|uniref:VOC family protein n=1 Tax=Tropicimonas sp. TaxID=2067044 RepID=UPI003A8AA170
MKFDHIAIACETLDAGTRYVEDMLGVAPGPVGYHPHFGTHNRLLSLGGSEYLEVIAIDPEAPAPDIPRWFDLDRFAGPPRPGNWVLRTGNLDAELARLGVAAGRPVALARGPYRWRMAVPPTGILPFDNLHPALIEWDGPHPAPALPSSGCALSALVVRHPEAERMKRLLALDDPRIAFETGTPGLQAIIATPSGLRVLG